MEKRGREASLFWVEESNEQIAVPMKPKRKVRPKKMEFVGWGSKSLIEFLQSIGKDCSKQLSQYEVTAIITEYVQKFNLLHPEKKKKIICDERLHSIFGKKSVPRIKVYDLLEAHFAENHDSSEDDLLYSSEEDEDDVTLTCKRMKVSSSEKKTAFQKKLVLETPKSCFASIIPENIKLLYLKRSLVQDLLKNPESFEGKVVGSYIRIKSDPNDYFQKNSHQLLLVTDVSKIPESGDVGKEALLQVQNMLKDIPIHMLSDDDFSKEECEDLRQRVKDGLLKRPTVVEVEEKARTLHEDITKHWLPRELAFLQNLIDRANEKGWRRELYEYLERKQLLQTPSEQSRLLLEVPKVIADELEPETTLQDPVQNVKQSNSSSPTSILRDASNICFDSGANQTLSSHSSDAAGSGDVAILPLVALSDLSTGTERNKGFDNGITCTKGPVEGLQTDLVQQEKVMGILTRNEAICSQGIVFKQVSQVIELSDDDEETEDLGGQTRIVDHPDIGGQAQILDHPELGVQAQIADHPESRIWHYLDPQGEEQGPFTMTMLKRWYDAHYFQPGFKVWRRGQILDHAVLLSDLLSQIFPK